jgi:hypothetical protein
MTSPRDTSNYARETALDAPRTVTFSIHFTPGKTATDASSAAPSPPPPPPAARSRASPACSRWRTTSPP